MNKKKTEYVAIFIYAVIGSLGLLFFWKEIFLGPLSLIFYLATVIVHGAIYVVGGFMMLAILAVVGRLLFKMLDGKP